MLAKTHASFVRVCFRVGIFLKLTQMVKVTVLHLGSGDSFFSITKWRENRVTSPACLEMMVNLKILLSS